MKKALAAAALTVVLASCGDTTTTKTVTTTPVPTPAAVITQPTTTTTDTTPAPPPGYSSASINMPPQDVANGTWVTNDLAAAAQTAMSSQVSPSQGSVVVPECHAVDAAMSGWSGAVCTTVMQVTGGQRVVGQLEFLADANGNVAWRALPSSSVTGP